MQTWLTLQSFYHFNILVHAGVDTSAGTEKCEFSAKTMILESILAYVILMFRKKKNSQELPECDVDKHRNASELESD